jgi:tetratricopeptide (TPR) repeat protein
MNKILHCLVWFGLLSNILLFGLSQISDSDAWGHALHGRIMLEKGRFAQFSDYSWFPDQEARHLNCVTQVLLCLVLKMFGGYPGLLFLVSTLLLATCLLLVKVVSKSDVPLPVAIASCLLFLVLGHSRFLPRGDFFNLLFWLIYLYLLENYWRRPSCHLWLLPAWQILWINLHQLAISGIGLIAAYTLGCYMAGKRAEAKKLALAASICFVVSFANFSGYQQLFLSFDVMSGLSSDDKKFFTNVGEFLPLTATPAPITFALYCASVVLVFSLCWANRRQTGWHHLLIFSGLTLATWQYARFIGFFAVYTAFLLPILARQFFTRAVYPPMWVAAKKIVAYNAMAILLFVCQLVLAVSLLTAGFYRWNGEMTECRLSPPNSLLPVEAVAFLERHKFSGNVYTDYNTGGYVAYHLYPACRMFVNSLGRTAYSTACHNLYLNIAEGHMNPTSVILPYDIQLFVLEHRTRENYKLIRWLYRTPDWLLVYADEGAVVFAAKESDFVRRSRVVGTSLASLCKHPGIADSPSNLALISSLLLDFGHSEEARNAAEQAVAINPRQAIALNNLGALACQEENWEVALRRFVESAEQDRRNIAPRRNIVKLFDEHIVFRSDNPLHQRVRKLLDGK